MVQNVKLYIKDTIEELRYKVAWPGWEELQSSAVVVLIASMMIALMVYGMDAASKFVLTTVYQLLG